MTEPNAQDPTAAILIIGDEILSGRTRDANMHYLAGELNRIGIALKEVRVVSDVHGAIVAAVNALRATYTHVFTSGGIGPTHDDITADAVAAAFRTSIGIREDARTLLAQHYERNGMEFNAARQRMARIPDGARLIDNPISVAPGFSLENVHVMAGVPNIFQAMVASLLPTLTGGRPLLSQTLRIMRGEGIIAGPLAALAEEFADLSLGSYPFIVNGAFGSNIVIRGHDAARIDAAMTRLAALFPEGEA
ncbi:MAG: competence/damage-inducible protein A [Rhodobacteraceae bacterium]|nr:competence/damage-inducible protein A [Paracoccaceae bacterium]